MTSPLTFSNTYVCLNIPFQDSQKAAPVLDLLCWRRPGLRLSLLNLGGLVGGGGGGSGGKASSPSAGGGGGGKASSWSAKAALPEISWWPSSIPRSPIFFQNPVFIMSPSVRVSKSKSSCWGALLRLLGTIVSIACRTFLVAHAAILSCLMLWPDPRWISFFVFLNFSIRLAARMAWSSRGRISV